MIEKGNTVKSVKYGNTIKREEVELYQCTKCLIIYSVTFIEQ